MKKKLIDINNLQDFKIYLDYPNEEMGFKYCKEKTDSMISWIENDKNLYLIRISEECIKHIQKSTICKDLRFVKSNNLGYTKIGTEFISIQILMPRELSEQEEYNNSHPTKNEIYEEIRDENFKNYSQYGRNDTEEDWQNNPKEDFQWGGLDGDEGHDAMWNCD